MRFSTEVAKQLFDNTPIVVCEIGTFKGDNALSILQNLNVSKIYLIDPYSKYDDYKGDSSCRVVDVAERIASDKLKEYSDKIVWIKEFSSDALKFIKDELDFVYIDGNHYHPYVDDDIKNYYPLVKKGGIVAGHDYSKGWPDVIEAVNDYFKDEEVKTNDRDWVVIKC